jgi:uncharacterized protein (DUF4415 family)
MTTKNNVSANSWVDPDDAPELTDAFFERAEVRIGGKLVRRGRPKKDDTKRLTSLRLDPDVVDYYRATGPSWQTRVNEVLRKAAGL